MLNKMFYVIDFSFFTRILTEVQNLVLKAYISILAEWIVDCSLQFAGTFKFHLPVKIPIFSE